MSRLNVGRSLQLQRLRHQLSATATNVRGVGFGEAPMRRVLPPPGRADAYGVNDRTRSIASERLAGLPVPS
jgi:hypothetical protein